jgi:hypothetical protein
VSPTNPTLAEVVRRLDDVVTRLNQLSIQLAETYVRKDVLAAREATTDQQLTGLEAEMHEVWKRFKENEQASATNRRLILSSFFAPLIVGVVVVLILSALGAR